MRFPSRRCMDTLMCRPGVSPRAGVNERASASRATSLSCESRNTWINAFSRRRWRVSVIRRKWRYSARIRYRARFRSYPLGKESASLCSCTRETLRFVAVWCCEPDLITFARVTALAANEIAQRNKRFCINRRATYRFRHATASRNRRVSPAWFPERTFMVARSEGRKK